MLVVTTPQPSASDIAVRAEKQVSLQLPVKVAGVVRICRGTTMQTRLHIFGQGRPACQQPADQGCGSMMSLCCTASSGSEYPCNREARASSSMRMIPWLKYRIAQQSDIVDRLTYRLPGGDEGNGVPDGRRQPRKGKESGKMKILIQ